MNFPISSTAQRVTGVLVKPFGVFIFFIFCGSILFFSGLRFPETTYNFLGSSKRVEMTVDAPVTQIFLAHEKNLEGVKIRFKNDRLYPAETIRTRLLADSCTGEEIASQTFSSFSKKGSPFRKFTFASIKASQEKQYCLMITYHSPYPQRSERPEILASEGGAFSRMSYTNEGKQRAYDNRSLQIRPVYGEASFGERLSRLENRLSQYKPFFMKGRMLLLGASVLFFSTLFLWLLTQQITHKKD